MIIIVRNPFRPEIHERQVFVGHLIDFLTLKFPTGFGGGNTVVLLNSEPLAVEDFDVVIKESDTVTIILNAPASGIEPWIIQLIVAVVLAVASYLLAPKLPTQKTGKAARRVYQIGSGQNVPALGNPITEHFGKLWFYPDVASQPYQFFANNEQYLHQILLIGSGDYELNNIRFGNTDISTLPAGLIEYQLFRPQDLQARYGIIQSQFNVYEDVVTSYDVQGLSLQRNTETTFFGQMSDDGNNYIENEDDPPSGQFAIGNVVSVYGNSNPSQGIVNTATITDIVGYKVVFAPFVTLPAYQWVQLTRADDGWRGWFVASPVGKVCDRIEVDVEFPNGLSRSNLTDGGYYRKSAYFTVEIQPINDDGTDNGALITNKYQISGSSRDPRRVTWTLNVPLGRYKVRMRKTSIDDFASDHVSTSQWAGLKAYCYNTPNQYAYGNVTLLAMKTKASASLPSVSDQISVLATRILPTVESDFTVLAPTVNPVDSFAAIVRENDPNGVDVPSLKALGLRWANTNGFNYRFDDLTTVYNCLQTVAYGHRATPESYASKLTMRVDDAKPYDQFIISQEHMVKDSYGCNIKLGSDAGYINGYRVAYQDPTGPRNKYVVYPAGAFTPEDLDLVGCTDEATALAHGQYSWSKRNALTRSVSFKTEYDALAYNVGDRISVLQNVVDRVRTVRVISFAGRVLTVDGVLDAETLYVKLRNEYGEPSEAIPAVMNGNQLTLSEDPPFPLFGVDAAQEQTTVSLGSMLSFSKSYIVMSLEPDETGVTVNGTTYSATPYLYPMPGEVIPP